jgi:Fe-Mn family superoxide dismutase
VADPAEKLKVMWFPNQDSPLALGMKPILTLDAWEHAYYIKHQNRRPNYVEAWWRVIDWDQVEEHFLA